MQLLPGEQIITFYGPVLMILSRGIAIKEFIEMKTGKGEKALEKDFDVFFAEASAAVKGVSLSSYCFIHSTAILVGLAGTSQSHVQHGV